MVELYSYMEHLCPVKLVVYLQILDSYRLQTSVISN